MLTVSASAAWLMLCSRRRGENLQLHILWPQRPQLELVELDDLGNIDLVEVSAGELGFAGDVLRVMA